MNVRRLISGLLCLLALSIAPGAARAQVYSPRVLTKGQIDTSTLASLAEGIYVKAGAATPRQKAEAIWRFFLTDGRFVTPGFWYHIAGWAYEEPEGEVLDPLKLLNSYGFGLCYHIAPLLQAVYLAGGFEDARVWFLTGHTVTEVYYDGAYHHYDADMLGYTTVGDGDPRTSPVASVSQLADDGSIMLSKLKSPKEVDASKVDYPWYPADVREAAIGGLASAFTTREDNWLFMSTRFPQGHSMDFVLRPGERLARYFQPESARAYYLPFRYDGSAWSEFPREIKEYSIRTEDGPHSQKDGRRWATGRLEYTPVLSDPTSYHGGPAAVRNGNLLISDLKSDGGHITRDSASQPGRAEFEMQSNYVIIDAEVSFEATLLDARHALLAEISVDAGKKWEAMERLSGPFSGRWRAAPEPKFRTEHGSLTAVSGKYGYLVRLTLSGPAPADGSRVRNVQLASRFQVNPRALPELAAGVNELSYRPGRPERRSAIPVALDRLEDRALRVERARVIVESDQSVLWPDNGATAEAVFELSAPNGAALSGFDAGARFLDLRGGLAPDKLTAETRTTALGAPLGTTAVRPEASLAWSLSPMDGFTPLWDYDPEFKPKDGRPVAQFLRWPEVDRQIRSLPPGTRKVYVRYRLKEMGLDSPRLAVVVPQTPSESTLEVTHQWLENGQAKEHTERIGSANSGRNYRIDVPTGATIVNRAVILHCPPRKAR
jgi:hypothetical protein